MAYSGPPFGWTQPDGYLFDNLGRCASCNADIGWYYTKKGNRAPLNADGVSHFATCPSADLYRRPKPKPEPEGKPLIDVLAPAKPVRVAGGPGKCPHSRVAIAAATLLREGIVEAYDAVYSERCPACDVTKRNTRLAASIWTLRHIHGWDIETEDVTGRLAVYRLKKPGTMPARMP